MIDFLAYGAVLEKLTYTDKFNIYRTEISENEYGAMRQTEPQLIYSEAPCRLSNKSIDSAGDNNESNIPIIKNNELFTSLTYDIMAGDIVEGYKAGKLWIKGICNEPSIYDSHQQVTILKEGTN